MTELEFNIDIEMLREAFDKKKFLILRRIFEDYEEADIAEAVTEIGPFEAAAAIRLVLPMRRAELFSYYPFEIQFELLEILPDKYINRILNDMDPVDRTHFLEDLPPALSSRYVASLDPIEKQMAWKLLSYPEGSVGRVMSPEYFSIPAGLNVSQAIEYIRWNASRYDQEALVHLFVIDNDGTYVGDMNIGALFVAENTQQSIEELVGSAYVAVSADDDQAVAVDVFRKYDRSAVAVIDEKSKLIGLVSAEDVFDIAEEEATEDIQQFGGAASLEDSYLNTSVWMLVRKRVGWLMILFLGGIWSGQALRNYETEFETYAFLVFFLPLIISSGGNSGSQAASLIIRGIAVREFELNSWFKIFIREMISGFGLGIVLGVMGFICALIWGLGYLVAGIIFFSLIGVVIFGAVTGAMLPFILKRLGLDPAVSSSPLIASLVDLFGIIIFFKVSLFILKNYGAV